MKTIKVILVVATIIFATGSCDDDTEYGNATLNSSNTVTLTSWFSLFDDSTDFIYTTIVSWPEITQKVIEKGVVLVYMKSGDVWYALPFSDGGTDWSEDYTFSVGLGQIQIYYSGYDAVLGSPGLDYVYGKVIRIVVLSNIEKKSYPDVDSSDYEEVSQMFHCVE